MINVSGVVITKPKIYLDSPPAVLDQPLDVPVPPTKRHLVTFHSGYPFSLAADRLANQARATGWFDTVEIVHPGASNPAMQTFATEHGDFVRNNPRGYGYWRWKPLLVQSLLASLPEGEHLYYMDAGCEISHFGSPRFSALDQELAERGILCFEIDFPEFGWCKREAAEAILGSWNDALMATRQIQATWFGLCNTAQVRECIAEWASWAIHGELITDVIAKERQHPDFHGHRHDQALWSLVLKKRGIQPMPQEDCFERWLYVPDSWALLAPIHGLRSRGRRSRIDRIAGRSSPQDCLANLRSPSLIFKGRLAVSRARILAIASLNQLRTSVRAAFHRAKIS